MCGIAGFVANPNRRQSVARIETIARAMESSLAHRGPDGSGVWIDHDAGAALVHRRLAVVDLSPAGHQPMVSADSRFVITYNGEVYSHLEIRADLETSGVRFRGHSDTEVILESIARHGVSKTAKRLIGMFALAVWDKQDRTLTLVRDRVGIKPVYWAKFEDLFIFGSELKAFRQHPGWSPSISPGAVAAFMRHNYIPAPHTIYEGVHKLEPGTILTLPFGGAPQFEKFWDARAVATHGLANLLREDDTTLINRLEALLTDAVSRRMMADVPLGAFLSGGVDSSLVAALMKASNSGPVKTFSIGFEDMAFNEAPYASAVAKHLGTDHTELVVSGNDALNVVPRLAEMYDEPFADSSQIPTYLVSAMTRKHVTVALSGDGGDEIFAGYNRYQIAKRFQRALSAIPHPMRGMLASSIRSLRMEHWDKLTNILPGPLPPMMGDKLYKVAGILSDPDSNAIYRRIVSHWDPSQVAPGAKEPRGLLWDSSIRTDFPSSLDRMQFLDLVTYLPDDILAKVDRASMAVALEARVPLLDHRVIELAWQLPQSLKMRGGVTKWILRQILYRHVPRELIERPKMGFGVPLGEWLRGPLREWASDLIFSRRIEDGLLDIQLVRQRWQEHLAGRRNWQYLLWDVLMLEAWRVRWAC
ncbi:MULTISPECIES: asparagine synthase (glutamine-hydrolyzing) [Bradyrhizobium]|uniref:asparagine synthase (glutamine-hydrolyzing) n=1 Tax=Bradyrhizobium brasilense TaxID=1419277 RepID=UPI001456A83F|nr:asparagine synthase (glutamine-hydrolyzing) [Bradyrhizobium brasilense]NLS67609.1 asparagine synthase (glutamine-hydrolyzing) [Bradyrhizobium brasilense]